jgi:hypothetical protein
MSYKSLLVVFVLLLTGSLQAAPSAQYEKAVQARIEKTYIVVRFADGTKSLVPTASLLPDDLAWLTELSTRSPLAKGNSQITVVKAPTETKTKTTIEISKTEGPLETVQLCQPSILRDQIGGTCMLYARVHWLDIAGYYTTDGTIYKIINGTPSENPWKESRYVLGLDSIVMDRTPKPVIHDLPSEENPFDWARQELRKGRPVLASFPREIWQALPPGFIAAHPWNGGKVGHQIVVNGFTWNKAAGKGTFHIINSWSELPQFDLDTDAAKGDTLVIEQSLSPMGEVQAATAREIVQAVTLIRTVGKLNLYEVQTNLRTQRMLAASEAAVHDLIEKGP